MPGRLRTGSSPSSTVIWDASYAAASELFRGASLRVEVLNALRVWGSGKPVDWLSSVHTCSADWRSGARCSGAPPRRLAESW